MRFADEPAERAPSRQITRGDGRGTKLEKGEFDRAIERLNEAASDEDDRRVVP
jgi:hypothetical protein